MEAESPIRDMASRGHTEWSDNQGIIGNALGEKEHIYESAESSLAQSSSQGRTCTEFPN